MEQLHTKLIPLLQAVTSQRQDEEEDFQRGAPGKKKIPGNEGESVKENGLTNHTYISCRR